MREMIKNSMLKLLSTSTDKMVTVDEISVELGISKKTFYKYYPEKRKLVLEICDDLLSSLKIRITRIADEWQNELWKLIGVQEEYLVHLANVHSSFFNEFHKYESEIIEAHQSFKENFLNDVLRELIVKGHRRGIFSRDLQIDLFIAIQLIAIEESIFGLLSEASRGFSLDSCHIGKMIIFNNSKGILKN